jgi:apurinic endonuclease APN1
MDQNDKQLILGWHTSINPSITDGIYFNEESLGDLPIRTAAQIFLKPPMKVSTTKITEEQIAEIKRYIFLNDVYLVVHGQYLLNFIREGSTIQWARKSLIDDIRTLNKIIPDENQYKSGVVIHLGKSVGGLLSNEQCIKNFTENIRNVIDNTMDCNVKIILETSTKTKGPSDIFHKIETFGKLKKSIERDLGKDLFSKRIGFCIDTCHASSSGYDIKTKESFEEFMCLWDTHIGIENITLFHLNDSKGDVGCCMDRHTEIGQGFIYKNEKSGLRALIHFAKNNEIPIIIESSGNQDIEIAIINSLL